MGIERSRGGGEDDGREYLPSILPPPGYFSSFFLFIHPARNRCALIGRSGVVRGGFGGW